MAQAPYIYFSYRSFASRLNMCLSEESGTRDLYCSGLVKFSNPIFDVHKPSHRRTIKQQPFHMFLRRITQFANEGVTFQTSSTISSNICQLRWFMLYDGGCCCLWKHKVHHWSQNRTISNSQVHYFSWWNPRIPCPLTLCVLMNEYMISLSVTSGIHI